VTAIAPPATALPDSPWWVRAFGPLYLTVYGHRDETEARRNAPRIAALLKLRHHDRVLDLACGEGRYARALAASGYRVTGIDASGTLLEEARKLSPMLPGTPTYLRRDMRDLPFFEQFEGVASLFTSFGYFDDRGGDLEVLDGARRALVPGGRFLLDFLNAPHMRATLVAESVETKDHWRIECRRRIDEATEGGPYVRKEVVLTDVRISQEIGRYEERVRLYAPDELDEALRASGLEPEGPRQGGFHGEPYDESALRFVRVARRRPR
jgi:SAM-dependent methyltransferase